jgi:hypothetical protein
VIKQAQVPEIKPHTPKRVERDRKKEKERKKRKKRRKKGRIKTKERKKEGRKQGRMKKKKPTFMNGFMGYGESRFITEG